MQPKGRYVKLNILDYLLIAVLACLLLALVFRGVGMAFAARTEVCRAEVEFVIRDLDQETVDILSKLDSPFYLQDGSLFAEQYTTRIQRTAELVTDEDGNMTESESAVSYKLLVTFTAEGQLAKDETFLLGGTRRLSTGESLHVTQNDVTYRVDILRVSVDAGL